MYNLFVYRYTNGETLSELFTLNSRKEAEELGEYLSQQQTIDWYSVSRSEESWYIGTYLEEKWNI